MSALTQNLVDNVMPQMPVIPWETFAQFGIAGMILAVFLFLFIIVLGLHAKTVKGIVDRLSQDNKASNENWRSTVERIEDRADRRAKETNIVLRDLTNVFESRGISTSKGINASG